MLAENSSGHKVKTFRTDNGGEYMSTEFENYLKSEGIKTIPKTPEQNGVSERMNRTLVEAVRSMLADSKLPHRFWAEALSTASYLLNRSPTKTLGDETPFEAWVGKKPYVKHLKAFGCVAYSHVPKDQRKKLDSKAKKCIFLGYAEQRKGYRLYDMGTSKIIHSRDVVFNESSRGIDPEQEENQIVQVESFPDEMEEDSNQEPQADSTEEVETETQIPRRTSSREIKRPDY